MSAAARPPEGANAPSGDSAARAAGKRGGIPCAAPRAAVVGAGWAGLAAAHELAAHGHAVTVFEASRSAGGRARTVAPRPRADGDTGRPSDPDNGQHLLLGAYTQTLALMRELGIDPDTRLLRSPLRLLAADGSFALRAPALPAPLHAVAALLGARGLGMKSKWAALRLLRALRAQAWQVERGLTVQALLAAHRQPAQLLARLWHPLCLAALNTRPEQACAQLFARVLRDSLDAPRDHSDLLLPRRDLSTLWPLEAASRHDMRYGHAVRQVEADAHGVTIDGERFDAAALAVPPAVAARLVPPHPAMRDAVRAMRAFHHLPIATLTLRLATPYRLAFPMLMLAEDPARGHCGQWLFDRGALLGHAARQGELAVVSSVAVGFEAAERAARAAALIDQVREQLPRRTPLPPVQAWELYVDKRATFAAVPGLARPGPATAWPRLALCGDWTDTGYPATLEGAVRSGRRAGRLLAAAAAAG